VGYVFEPLDPSRHDRAAFSCGEPTLDAYLKTQARQDMERDLALCWVLCEPGKAEIVGYYTLTPTSVQVTTLPPEIAKTAARYPVVPAVLLGRMGVDQLFQRQHFGNHLLYDALRRTLRGEFAFKVIVVDALHARAAAFYSHYGFTAVADNPLRLYLPMAHVRTLFSSDVPPGDATSTS
jgi:predicted GNAT family N-acyltransferase